MAAEDTVEVVARGEADMVVVVASRIVGVPGVEFIGLIPAEVQTNIGFATGVSSASKEPEAARALVRFLTAPAAEPVLRKTGIEPFVESGRAGFPAPSKSPNRAATMPEPVSR